MGIQEEDGFVAEHHGSRVHRSVTCRSRTSGTEGVVGRAKHEDIHANANLDIQSSCYQRTEVGEVPFKCEEWDIRFKLSAIMPKLKLRSQASSIRKT